ncbi:MAG: hypothetical protein UIB61_07685 [Treponema sp.]|nr:hypothetical protein [Treponema sp.]
MKTEAPSNSNRNVEWAVETFRPLLKDLHLQNVSKDSPTIIKTADFRNLIVKGMGRCIIAVQRQVISDGQSGYCTFIYNKEYNLYILSIVIDENLFNNDSLDSRTKRKALGIHEFVHCVAILMSISLLGTGPNPLIERLKSILNEKLTVTTSDDFTQLFKALGTIAENNDSQNISLFSDKHFRTGFEDFPDDYADLYLNFLFSYKLLKEIINFERMETFKNLLLAKDSKRLVSFLNDIFNEIVENKALDRNFVMQRFCYFLPRLSCELLRI